VSELLHWPPCALPAGTAAAIILTFSPVQLWPDRHGPPACGVGCKGGLQLSGGGGTPLLGRVCDGRWRFDGAPQHPAMRRFPAASMTHRDVTKEEGFELAPGIRVPKVCRHGGRCGLGRRLGEYIRAVTQLCTQVLA
jgi:hypothetical protein